MIRDILTVMWREWRDMPFLRGGIKGGILSQLIFIGVLGVMLPSQSGPGFVNSPLAMFASLWGPFLLTSSLVADTFAGERERHTLETHLASRLPDRAILFGKVATVVCYAWGVTILILLLGLITTNIAYGHGKLLIYPAPIGLGALVLGLLTALLISCIGVIVSLKAATVRQAAQTLSMGFLAMILIPVVGPMLPKQWIVRLAQLFFAVGTTGIIAAVAAVLCVADAALLNVAMSRFRRSKLILE